MVVLFQQNHDAGQVDKGLETADQLVISRRNPAEVFQFIEKTFDQMPLFVLPPITFPRVRIIFFWRYGVSSFLLGDVVPNFP